MIVYWNCRGFLLLLFQWICFNGWYWQYTHSFVELLLAGLLFIFDTVSWSQQAAHISVWCNRLLQNKYFFVLYKILMLLHQPLQTLHFDMWCVLKLMLKACPFFTLVFLLLAYLLCLCLLNCCVYSMFAVHFLIGHRVAREMTFIVWSHGAVGKAAHI